MKVKLAGGCSGEWCGFSGELLGAAIGSSIMSPIGVHFALLAHDEKPVLLIPLAEIIGSVAIDRRTGRRAVGEAASVPVRGTQ